MRQKKTTFCRICEATCGLTVEVEVEDNRILDIQPDPEHVVSRGFACVKGTRWASLQHSPDRVTTPLARIGERWTPIGWDQSLDEMMPRTVAIPHCGRLEGRR